MPRKNIFRRKTVTIRDEDQISKDNHDSRSISSTDSFNTYHGNIGTIKKSILKRRFKTSPDSLPGDITSDTETASQFSSHTNKSRSKFKRIISKICDKLKKSSNFIDAGEIDANYFDGLSESEFVKDKLQIHDQNTSNTINANNDVGSNENIVVTNMMQTPEVNLDLEISIENIDYNKNFNNTGDVKVTDKVDYAYERSSDYETRSSGISYQSSSPDGLTTQGKIDVYSMAKLDYPQVVYKADTEIFSSRLQDTQRDDKTFDLNFGNERELTELDYKSFDVIQTIGQKNSEHMEYSASLQTCVSIYDKPNVFEICLEESFVDKLESVYNETENTMAILDLKKAEDSKLDDTGDFNVLYSDPYDENHTIPLVSKDSLIIDEAPEKNIDGYSSSSENIDPVQSRNTRKKGVKDEECIIQQTNDRPDMDKSQNRYYEAERLPLNGGIVSPGLSDIYEYSDKKNDSSFIGSTKSLSITEPVMNACLSPKFEVVYSDYKSPMILNRALLNELSNSEESEIGKNNKILQSSLNVVETEFIKNLNDTSSATTEIADVKKSNPSEGLMRVPNVDKMGMYVAKPEKIVSVYRESNIDDCKVDKKETSRSTVVVMDGYCKAKTEEVKIRDAKRDEVSNIDTKSSESKNITYHLNGDKCKIVEHACEDYSESTENVVTKNEKPIEVEDFVQLETVYVLKDNTYVIETLDTDGVKEDLNNDMNYASEKLTENDQERSLGGFEIDTNLKETTITNERYMHVIPEEENESSDDQLDIMTSDKCEDPNLICSIEQNQGPKLKKTKEQGDMSVTQKSTNEVQENKEEHLYVETEIITSAEQCDKVSNDQETNPMVEENSMHENKKQDITATKVKKETSQLNVLMTGDEKIMKGSCNDEQQEKEKDRRTILDDEFSTSSDASIKNNQEIKQTLVEENKVDEHGQSNEVKPNINETHEKHEENLQEALKGSINDTSKMDKVENEKGVEHGEHEQQKSKTVKTNFALDKNNRLPDNPKLRDGITYSYDETFTDFDTKPTESLACSPLQFDAKNCLKNKLNVDGYSPINILQFHKRLQKSTKKCRNKRASIKGLIERRKPTSKLTNSSTNLKVNSLDQNITETSSVSLTPPCQSLLQFYKAEMERAAAIHTYVQCFSGSSNVECRLRMRRSYRSPYQLIKK